MVHLSISIEKNIFGGLYIMTKFKCNSCNKEVEAEEAPQCCEAPMVAVTEESAEATQESTEATTDAAESTTGESAAETSTESTEEPKTE